MHHEHGVLYRVQPGSLPLERRLEDWVELVMFVVALAASSGWHAAT